MSEKRNGADSFDNEAFNRFFREYEADYHWALKQGEFYERYSDQVVVFYKREVLGSGPRHTEALEAAEAALDRAGRPRPPRAALLFVHFMPLTDFAIWDTPDSWYTDQPAESQASKKE